MMTTTTSTSEPPGGWMRVDGENLAAAPIERVIDVIPMWPRWAYAVPAASVHGTGAIGDGGGGRFCAVMRVLRWPAGSPRGRRIPRRPGGSGAEEAVVAADHPCAAATASQFRARDRPPSAPSPPGIRWLRGQGRGRSSPAGLQPRGLRTFPTCASLDRPRTGLCIQPRPKKRTPPGRSTLRLAHPRPPAHRVTHPPGLPRPRAPGYASTPRL